MSEEEITWKRKGDKYHGYSSKNGALLFTIRSYYQVFDAEGGRYCAYHESLESAQEHAEQMRSVYE